MPFSYALEIVQEPVRARMCGLGDKDRRHVTPPPFVKLKVTDSNTGDAVNVDNIDTSNFVLIVELWSADETEDLTLNQNVKISPRSTSFSSEEIQKIEPEVIQPTHTTKHQSHFQTPLTESKIYPEDPFSPSDVLLQNKQTSDTSLETVITSTTGTNSTIGNRSSISTDPSSVHRNPSLNSIGIPNLISSISEAEGLPSRSNSLPDETPNLELNDTKIPSGDQSSLSLATASSAPNAEESISPKSSIGGQNSDSEDSLGDIPIRNLIGGLVVSSFKLYDDKMERGIWFILQDLSVRIEGEFKLKLTFVDIATSTAVSSFSNAFQVFSAKKFPGVVESTPLGQVFASQGVKIFIRRESKILDS